MILINRNRINILLILYFTLNGFYAIGQGNTQDLINLNTAQSEDYKVIEIVKGKGRLQYSITEYASLLVAQDKLPHEGESSLFWMVVNNKTNITNKVLEIYAPNMEGLKVIGVSYKNLLKPKMIFLRVRKLPGDLYYLFVDDRFDLVLLGNLTNEFRSYELKLFNEESFLRKRTAIHLFYGITLGVFIVLFLYHLVLFLKVKEPLYLYYIFYIFIISILVNQHIISVFQNCIICEVLLYLVAFYSGLWFAYKFLLLNMNFKRYFVYIAIIVSCVFLLTFLFNRTISKYVILTCGICIFTIITIGAFVRFKEFYRPAKWFSLPWLTLLIVFTIMLFVDKQTPIYEFGFILHLGFLAMALASKLNEYKVAKSVAESKEIEALSERDRMIFEQNKALKELIDVKNKEIISRNNELEKQQNEIKDKTVIIQNTNKRLIKINEELYLKNHEITTHNNELQKHKELLEIIIRKRSKKLIAARERAEKAEKLKANFLSNLTDEIRIPMNAITGFASMLYNKELSVNNRAYFLEKISKNVDVLLETIDNIVLLARIQSGIIKPKIKAFVLDDLLRSCIEYYQNEVDTENKNLNIRLEDSMLLHGTTIKSDGNKLKLVINKLMQNAIKFSEKGNITLSGNIYRENNQKDFNSSLVLSVSDNGIGIEKEKLEFIFERFAKIENDKTKLYYGAGIGLAIVKGIVDLLHGKILVESKPGIGTKFSVAIPVNI